MDQDFLNMLRCPMTQKPLRLASAAELSAINGRIRAGSVKNRGGEAVTRELSAGLLPDGSAVIYPILEDIPILLSTEAIPLTGAGTAPAGSPRV
jgi:uncharacterized protein YbaR (Trm112 family)